MLASGDESAHQVALNQPMKLAAMEGIYRGEERQGLVAAGILNPAKTIGDDKLDTFLVKVEIPYVLSVLGYHSLDAFVPGVNDLVYGNAEHKIMSVSEKMVVGKEAVSALGEYKVAQKANDEIAKQEALKHFETSEKYLGYGYLKDPKEAVPDMPLVFYSFHTMVGLGSFFIFMFFMILYNSMTGDILKQKWLLLLGVLGLPLGYVAQEAGWIVAEAGRQPWAIQDMLPVHMATSNIAAGNVMITFWMFAVIFTALLIAEVSIMTKQIKIGPEGH